MYYYVGVLTNTKKGYKMVKKFKTYENCKKCYDELKENNKTQSYFTYEGESFL